MLRVEEIIYDNIYKNMRIARISFITSRARDNFNGCWDLDQFQVDCILRKNVIQMTKWVERKNWWLHFCDTNNVGEFEVQVHPLKQTLKAPFQRFFGAQKDSTSSGTRLGSCQFRGV